MYDFTSSAINFSSKLPNASLDNIFMCMKKIKGLSDHRIELSGRAGLYVAGLFSLAGPRD